MKRIGIVVDHPKRDLAGCTRIAYELARRGAEAVLLPHYEQGIEAPLLMLDAVLMNNARPHYREIMAGYREAGTAIFVLDTEGGVLGENGFNAPHRIAQRFRESGLGAYVDGYLFWGERLYEAFHEHGGLPAEKLEITGCPRYDICHPKWRTILHYPRSGFFLINTNFNAVNPLLASGKDADRQPLRNQGVTDAEIEGRYSAARGVFDRLMPELRRLVKAMGAVNFVLRPHPFERAEFYREHFADCPNLSVDDSGDVMAVLSACRGMLHVNCGTSVEAIFLGVLPVMLEYVNNDAARAMNPLPSRVSHAVWSFEELCEVITHPEVPARGFPFEENYRKYIQPWFFVNDGEAGARVAEVLLGRLPAAGTAVRQAQLSLSLRSGQRQSTLPQRIQGVTAFVLGTPVTRAIREMLDPGRVYKRFDRAQVADLLQRFASVDAKPVAAEASTLSSPVAGRRMLSILVRPVV
jgi:surface carbohydrate biosynthesis protein